MKIVIKKNLSVLDADENFTYVIEATHHDRIVNQSIVKVPSNEYNQPCEEKCGSLTRDSIDGILDQLTYEFKDFDPTQVPITEEIIRL